MSDDKKPTRDELVARKGELERRLLDYSRDVYTREQAKIRKRHIGDMRRSLAAWMDRRSELDAERAPIVRQLIDVQRQLAEINAGRRAVAAANPKPPSVPPAQRDVVDAKLVFLKLNEILAELRKITEWLGFDLDTETEAAR